jgi:hypothetical protein
MSADVAQYTDCDLRDDIPLPQRCISRHATFATDDFDLRDDIPLPERLKAPFNLQKYTQRCLWFADERSIPGSDLDASDYEFLENVRVKGHVDGYSLGGGTDLSLPWGNGHNDDELPALVQARSEWKKEREKLARICQERRERWRREQKEWDAHESAPPPLPDNERKLQACDSPTDDELLKQIQMRIAQEQASDAAWWAYWVQQQAKAGVLL